MMLRTRYYRKSSKQPVSDIMSPPAGPVSPSEAEKRWPIRSEEHHRWGAHESLLTSIARVNASSTSIFRNQGDAILALRWRLVSDFLNDGPLSPSVHLIRAPPRLLSVRRFVVLLHGSTLGDFLERSTDAT